MDVESGLPPWSTISGPPIQWLPPIISFPLFFSRVRLEPWLIVARSSVDLFRLLLFVFACFFFCISHSCGQYRLFYFVHCASREYVLNWCFYGRLFSFRCFIIISHPYNDYWVLRVGLFNSKAMFYLFDVFRDPSFGFGRFISKFFLGCESVFSSE